MVGHYTEILIFNQLNMGLNATKSTLEAKFCKLILFESRYRFKCLLFSVRHLTRQFVAASMLQGSVAL